MEAVVAESPATQAAPALPTTLTLPARAVGEVNAGLILNEHGTPLHWLILLPGDADEADWQTQMDWAKALGGDLPDRRELNLLSANAQQHFEDDRYWSSEQHAAHSGCAWCQHFYYGSQDYVHKDIKLRARAVRRSLVI